MPDLYSIKFKTSINLNYADSLEKKLAKYKIDAQKEQRETKKECKVCFYLYRPCVAGQAFTKSNCVECKTEMTSSSTDTNKFCFSCADKFKICVYCGADRELREGRRK